MEDFIIETIKIGGPSAAILTILYFIIRKFLNVQESQEKRFMDFIENHLKHNTETMNDLKKSIRELCIWLKNNNKK